MRSGITVELEIEDRRLADRVEAMLHDLDVDVAERGSDSGSITITDVPPEAGPDRAVILLTDDVDALAALRDGVAGLLPRSAELADLRVALDAVLRGLVVAPLHGIEHTGHDGMGPSGNSNMADIVGLSSREIEVLSLMAEGASNKEIAQRLAISIHTAKFHVASILEKLDATGRTDAVAHAVRLGLLML